MIAQITNFAPQFAPVVALHSSASSSRQWKQLATDLTGRFPFYTFDLPGYGKSPLREDHTQSGTAACAEPVIREIERIGQPVHLIGHSMGGAIAVKVALLRPDLVKSLAVYEPTVFHLLKNRDPQAEKLLREIQLVAGVMTASVASGENAAGMKHFLDFWNGEGFWDDINPSAKQKFSDQVGAVLNDFSRFMHEDWSSKALEALAMPTLIMMGMESPMPAQQISIDLAKAIPNSRLAILPELGHMAPAFQPEWVNPRFLEHINASERSVENCSWPLKVAA